MKNIIVKAAAILLLISTVLACFAGCSPDQTDDNGKTAEPDTNLQINVAALSGSTGYGMAKLMTDAADKKTALNYAVSVESSPKIVQDSLIAGQLDIAALPTNKAAMIASATDGKIQVVAVNTLGVMYLVTTDDTPLSTFEDLRGKTIGIPEEPSYILTALCTANGLTVGTDVTVETYATPADLLQLVIKGDVTCAVLPEPLLSTAMSKNKNIRISMNLTEQWESAYNGSKLMQGCVVVRTEWAENHPAELAKFLEEYKNSIEYVKGNAEAAAPMIERYFGTEAAVAAKAIANCNLVYIDGDEMKNGLQSLYNVLKDIPAANIGEKAPGDDFYYTKK